MQGISRDDSNVYNFVELRLIGKYTALYISSYTNQLQGYSQPSNTNFVAPNCIKLKVTLQLV